MKKVISTPAAPKAVGPYSQGVVKGSLLFTSGQIAIEPDTGHMHESIEMQTAQALNNVLAIVHEAGSTPADVIKVNIFLTDMNNFAKVNAIYERFFTEPYPARSCVGVASLPKNALIEIEAIAEVK